MAVGTGIELCDGGAQAALTTSEAYVDLSALAGCEVAIYCDDQDIWFSGAVAGTSSGSLVTSGASAASKTSLVADRLAKSSKAFREINKHPVLVVKTVTGTGTLKVKVVRTSIHG